MVKQRSSSARAMQGWQDETIALLKGFEQKTVKQMQAIVEPRSTKPTEHAFNRYMARELGIKSFGIHSYHNEHELTKENVRQVKIRLCFEDDVEIVFVHFVPWPVAHYITLRGLQKFKPKFVLSQSEQNAFIALCETCGLDPEAEFKRVFRRSIFTRYARHKLELFRIRKILRLKGLVDIDETISWLKSRTRS